METSKKIARSDFLTSRTALETAYRKKDLHTFLRQNGNLPEDIWFKLYTHRPRVPVQEAAYAVAHTLSEQQIDYVLSKETRVYVLSLLVCYNELNSVQYEKVLAMKNFNASVAQYWLGNKNINPNYAPQIALKASGREFLQWLTKQTYETLFAEKAVELFNQWDGHIDRLLPEGILEDLLYLRPELIEAYVSHPNCRVQLVAASSSYLQGLKLQEKLTGLTAGQIGAQKVFSAEKLKVLEKLISNPNLNLSLAETITKVGAAIGLKSGYVAKANKRIKAGYPNIESSWETLTDSQQTATIGNYALGGRYRDAYSYVPLWVIGPLVGNQHLSPEHFHLMAEKILYNFASTPLAAKFRLAYGEEIYSSYFLVEVKRTGFFAGYFYAPLTFEDADTNAEPLKAEVDIEWLRTMRVALIPHQEDALVYLQQELGSNEKAWEVFWSICDDYSGTLSELIDICHHI